MRFHVQTSGAELSADKPELNLVRVSIQALAAILGGTQSLHTNSFDEALSLPTEFSASLAVDSQTILQQETDLLSHVDPFEGSIVVEKLTDQIISDTQELIQQINSLGGAMKAIKVGFQKNQISSEALKISLAFESGEKIKVGFSSDRERKSYFEENAIQKLDRTRVGPFRKDKEIDSQGDLLRILDEIEATEFERGDVLMLMRRALKAGASLGQIVQALENLEARTLK